MHVPLVAPKPFTLSKHFLYSACSFIIQFYKERGRERREGMKCSSLLQWLLHFVLLLRFV